MSRKHHRNNNPRQQQGGGLLGRAAVLLLLTVSPDQASVCAVSLKAERHHPGNFASPYALLAQTSSPGIVALNQQLAASADLIDSELLDVVPQAKSDLVQTDQRLELVTDADAKVKGQNPTSGAIDLEGDMLASKPEHPSNQMNAQLSADSEKKSQHQYADKNAEIRSKITMLEDQIRHEEQLAKKLKGDQNMLASRQAMTETEAKLDSQISGLRKDLKISGEEAKIARLKAEQAVISQKIRKAHKRSDEEDESDDDERITSLADSREEKKEEKKAEEPKKEEKKEEPKKPEEKKEEAKKDEPKKDDKDAKKDEKKEEKKDEPKKEEKKEEKKDEPKKEEKAADKPAEKAADKPAGKDDSKELLEQSKKIIEQSAKMTERLESIEKSLKDGGGKDKDKEKSKDEPKKEEPPAPVDGWEKIEKYFKGKQGVGKAKKFIKLLNMMSMVEE